MTFKHLRKSFAPALAVALALWTPRVSDAQEGAEVEEGVEVETDDGPSLAISGFVDASVFVPIDGFPEGEDDYVLGLDQVEVDFEATVVSGLTLRTDLNVFPPQGLALDDSLLEQGYVDYLIGGGETGGFFTAGKRNAPVGIESLDPVDMYQFSHGLLFDNATPSNLTGFFGGYRGDVVSAMAWVTNDWDNPSTPENALVGGRVEYARDDGHVGVSSTIGPLGEDNVYQLMVDLDAAWAFGGLTLFLEGNYGLYEEDDLTSLGVLVKANYAFTDALSATVRYDWLDREYADPAINAMSVTGAFLFGIIESFGGIVEVRADIPDEGDTAVSAALELTASY